MLLSLGRLDANETTLNDRSAAVAEAADPRLSALPNLAQDLEDPITMIGLDECPVFAERYCRKL